MVFIQHLKDMSRYRQRYVFDLFYDFWGLAVMIEAVNGEDQTFNCQQ